MKLLRKMMDGLRPTFTTGKLRLLHPAYDAIDSFLYSVGEKSDRAPHVRGPMNLKRYMSIVIVGLMPCIAASIYFFGWRILAMIVVTYAAGLSVELGFAMLRKEEINEGFFVTGLLYPLILPPTLPLWMVAVGIIFGVLISKELFGGTGRNPFNPALVARCLLLLGYPLAMSNAWAPPLDYDKDPWYGRLAAYQYHAPAGEKRVDVVSRPTPMAVARKAKYDESKMEPARNLFWGNVRGSAGETCVPAILLGAALILITGVGSWRSIVAVLGSFAALVGVLHSLYPQTFGPAGWHLLAGGLMFGAVFMATDPVSSPHTKFGQWVYGIIIGCSTVLIRHLSGYMEGMMFAILLGNIFAPILDEIATGWYLRRIQRER